MKGKYKNINNINKNNYSLQSHHSTIARWSDGGMG